MYKLVVLFGVLELINGHGMVLEPVNRASRWRFDESAPINYNDNELFCGGFAVQWELNDGKCGVCGDDWSEARPRRHELGGEFGEGVVVNTYKQNDLIPVGVLLTKNHKGYFKFDLCDLDSESEEDDNCFEKYPLTILGGNTIYVLPSATDGWYNTTVVIPSDLNCKHCIFRWTYTAGNSWGECEDGNGAVGCGKQEHFRTCSDISITE